MRKDVWRSVWLQYVWERSKEAYTGLASYCAGKQWKLYKLRPKIHLFPHILPLGYVLQHVFHFAMEKFNRSRNPLRNQLRDESSCAILSPLTWACWTDEDYVGKLSRLARRLNASQLIVTRVMTRSLMKYWRYFTARMQ